MNVELTRIVERLESRQPLQALMPKNVWDYGLDQQISELPLIGESTPQAALSALIALRAGLHLLNESLDASHEQSQEIEDDATGCYWHGIMHRMEGDFTNANYWFHMAGAHPAMRKLQERAADWLRNSTVLNELPDGAIRGGLAGIARQARWSAGAFTEMIAIQESSSASEETRGAMEYMQHLELSELFAHTYASALHLLI